LIGEHAFRFGISIYDGRKVKSKKMMR